MEASEVESQLESALPRELVLGEPFLLLHILSFLPAADLGRATLVCRHFYAVGAQDGDYLWRNLLAQDRKLEDWRDVRRKETARAYVTNDRLFARAWQSGDLQVVTLSGHKVRLPHKHLRGCKCTSSAESSFSQSNVRTRFASLRVAGRSLLGSRWWSALHLRSWYGTSFASAKVQWRLWACLAAAACSSSAPRCRCTSSLRSTLPSTSELKGIPSHLAGLIACPCTHLWATPSLLLERGEGTTWKPMTSNRRCSTW
jgi:hypothetical protein